MSNKHLFLLTIFFAVIYGAFSTPLESMISRDNISRLHSGESVAEVQLRNPSLRLVPQHAQLRQFTSGLSNNLDPNLSVERLYLYKKPSSGNWNNQQRLNLFNKLTAVSSLAGIEYFSQTRQTMRTFYEVSAAVDGPNSRTVIPDPSFGNVPSSFSFYARQRDLTFGDNVYQYTFTTTQDAFFFMQENMTPLTVGIVPAIGRNRLRTAVAVIDSGEYLLIYIASMARASTVMGMGDRIGASFGNRADAIFNWFTGIANSVF